MNDLVLLKKKHYQLMVPPVRILIGIVRNEEGLAHDPGFQTMVEDNFRGLVDFFERQRTTYFLYYYFQHQRVKISDSKKLMLKRRVYKNTARSLQQTDELKKISHCFNDRALSYTLIKGPHLAGLLYGKEAVKVSVDMDVMVNRVAELNDFHAVLIHEGYSSGHQAFLSGTWRKKLYLVGKKELQYYHPITGLVVDLHLRPLANILLTGGRYNDFFSDLRKVPFEGIEIPVLRDEKYLVYLCHHGASHQFSRIGWLIDIREFYLKIQPYCTADKILAEARALNSVRSLLLAFYLKYLFFDIQPPPEIEQLLKQEKQLDRLAVQCLASMANKTGYDLTWKARWKRFYYLIRLNQGWMSKADILLGVFFRMICKF